MNKLKIILFLVVFCSCSPTKRQIADGIDIIPIETNRISSDASEFIEKIEIVPLETNDSSLIGYCKKLIYDKEMDIYAIYTKAQTVFTFTGNGKYIDNSKRMEGQGPNEYYMVLDINFNPYLKGIDLLNPNGIIYTYSPTFNLLSKRKIKSEFPVNRLMALDTDDYIFTHPFVWTGDEVMFVNMKTQQDTDVTYDGTISVGNTLNVAEAFYHVGNDFYFVPIGVNYYCYRIDVNEKKLFPCLYLDFGDKEIKKDGLPGRATVKRTDSEKESSELVGETEERAKYLRQSGDIIPLLKFFNDDYVYVFFNQNRDPGANFIFDRKKNKGFLLKNKKPFIMQYCRGIVDNVLFAVCNPEEVSMYTERKLMSAEEIHKMEQLREDDNPVILKYFLRK